MTNPALAPGRRRAIVAAQVQAAKAEEARPAQVAPPKPKRKLQGKKLALKETDNEIGHTHGWTHRERVG